MRPLCVRTVLGGIAAAALAGTALAAPAIKIYPPNHARFLVDQHFDIRVEFTPSAGSISTPQVTLDGAPMTGTLDAANGMTFYKLSSATTGTHTIAATGNDDSGAGNATATFEIVDPNGSNKKARNVIIFLGDGMGASHRTAAQIMRYGEDAGYVKGVLSMDQFPGLGLVHTHSLNSIVTDSAPGMANYVTGNKAKNNQEGVWPDNTVPPSGAPDNSLNFDNPRIEYFSEYMHRKYNKVTGIVSTADVEDATPAANAVHTANRNAGTGVCDQYFDERATNGLKVLLGGGRRWFLPAGQPGSSRAASTDYQLTEAQATALGVPTGAIDPQRDLIGDFTNAGYTYVANRTDLLKVPANATQLLGLFGYGNMNVAWDKLQKQRNPGQPGVVDDYQAPDQPMLDEMAAAALNALNQNAEGFTLMVEGAHIDKQSHLMDGDRAVVETIELDNAVKTARDFADKKGAFADRAGEAGDTVILVTADHECSGFSIIGASTKTTADLQATAPADKQASVGTYDAAGFPSYPTDANGYPMTLDPDHKMLIGFGANADRTEDWISNPRPMIDSLLPSDIAASLETSGYLPVGNPSGQPSTGGPNGNYGSIRRDAATGYFITGQVPGDQAVHTATDIPLNAYGPGWEQFVGVQDNTDIFFKLSRASLGGYDGTGSGITGDMNNDGSVNIADAVWLLRKIVGAQ